MSSSPFRRPFSQTLNTIPQTQSVHPLKLRQAQEKKMSIARTFYLAHKARAKLSAEASKHDHDLRLLVGHANMLDTLMIYLAEAEQDQEQWFNNVLRENTMEEEGEIEEPARDRPRIHPETEAESEGRSATDYQSDSSDSEDDFESEDIVMQEYTLSRLPSQPASLYRTITIGINEVEEYDEDEDAQEDEDSDGLYALTRSPSHQPPQLVADISDDEEEESTPPSPPTVSLPTFSTKENSNSRSRTYFGRRPGSHHQNPQLSPPTVSEPFLESREFYHRDQSAIISTF